MKMKQRTICIVYCDQLSLPILDYIDSRSLVALSLSGGVIIWVYKGLAMLIPPGRIGNLVRMWEATTKFDSKRIKSTAPRFTSDEAIKLPSQIARALVGEDE